MKPIFTLLPQIAAIRGSVIATILLSVPVAIHAQAVLPPAQPEQQTRNPDATPDLMEISRLVWTTMIAVDQANRTGNYSVLRDLGAPSFYQANNPARLAEIFQALRKLDLGLGRTVQLSPFYDANPAIDENGLLHVKGGFATRPIGIRFDFVFEPLNGDWALHNIGISSFQSSDLQSGRIDGSRNN